MKTIEPGKAEIEGGAYSGREGITLLLDEEGGFKVTFWYDGGEAGDVELKLTRDELLTIFGPNVGVKT